MIHPTYGGTRTPPQPLTPCPCCTNGRWGSPNAHRYLCTPCYELAVRLMQCTHESARESA